MRTNCLPTKESLDLVMDRAWPVVAKIAGALMAGGRFSTVEFAVRTAREIVATAKADPPSKDVREYSINGKPCDIETLATKLTVSDCQKINTLELGGAFYLAPGVALKRTR
jgi:hypothetical protein